MRNVLIVGVGGIGKRHVEGFIATGRARVSIVELDEAKRVDARDRFELDQVYASFDDANLGDFDAAVICTPANLHVPMAGKCAAANLPFFLEKPLAVTMDGVDELLSEVARRNLVARVAFVRRASEETLQLRQQLQSGRLGQLRLCHINTSQEYPKYRPDYREIYFAREESGGGTVLDGATHMIDLLLWLMGRISDVSAMYDQLVLQGVEVEDTALITLRFESGQMALININQFQKPNVATVEMAGTEGNLLLDFLSGDLRFASDDSGNWDLLYSPGDIDSRAFHQDRFRKQAAMFLDALDGEPCHLTTLEEARESLRVALAAKESWKTKRIIHLNGD